MAAKRARRRRRARGPGRRGRSRHEGPPMLNVIAWRVLQFPLILAIIYLISFLFIWVAPGSPFGQSERKLNEVTERALKQKFHAESARQFLGWYPYNIV